MLKLYIYWTSIILRSFSYLDSLNSFYFKFLVLLFGLIFKLCGFIHGSDANRCLSSITKGIETMLVINCFSCVHVPLFLVFYHIFLILLIFMTFNLFIRGDIHWLLINFFDLIFNLSCCVDLFSQSLFIYNLILLLFRLYLN